MGDFFNVNLPDQALAQIFSNIKPLEQSESTLTLEAIDCVTAEPILAPHPLPTFWRSAMDGYAVKSQNTNGASQTSPVILKVKGEKLMDKPDRLVTRQDETWVDPLLGQSNLIFRLVKADGMFRVEMGRGVRVGEWVELELVR